MLALVFFIKHFKHYLYRRKFLVHMDHGSLQYLMNFKNPEGQVAQWIEILTTYQMEIEHHPGRKQGNAMVKSGFLVDSAVLMNWSTQLLQLLAVLARYPKLKRKQSWWIITCSVYSVR